MKFLLGTKGAMTTYYAEDGAAHAVTEVHAGPCTVTQVKTQDHDGTTAVQVGFGKVRKLKKPQQGHLKDLSAFRYMREFVVHDPSAYQRGQELTADLFAPGEHIRVAGTTKGRGFQGVVKRHGFHGSPASHGHKDQLRMPGSIGATDAARVFKGVRMAGRMGGVRRSVTNLEVLAIDAARGVLLIKGAVPGPRNGLLEIVGSSTATESSEAAASQASERHDTPKA